MQLSGQIRELILEWKIASPLCPVSLERNERDC